MDFKLFPGAQSRADDYELITDRVCVVGFIRRRKKGSGAPMRALLKRLGGPPERIPEGSRRLGDGLRRSRGVWGALGGSRGLWGVFWKPLEESGRAPAEPREPSEGS